MLMDDIRKILIFFNDEANFPEGTLSSLEKAFLDNINNVVLVNGRNSIIQQIIEIINNTRSSIIITIPELIPEILQDISEQAYQKQGARFMFTSSWDEETYAPIIRKMQVLGNIQFRQLNQPLKICYCSRDATELMLGIIMDNEDECMGVISENKQILKLFSKNIVNFVKSTRPPMPEGVKARLRKKYDKIKNPDKKKKFLQRFQIEESDLI